MTWNAPNSGVGSITFYVAGNAANGNFNTSGDNIYATTYTVTQLPLITYTVSKTDPSCLGASDAKAYITGISGGAGGSYTITWPSSFSTSNDTAVSLSSGNYSVTVTDNAGNEEVKSFTINPGAGPSIASTVRSSVCGISTGQIQANVTGGTGSLSYTWASYPSITGNVLDSIPSGSYRLQVVDANGCIDSATISVPQSGALLQAHTSSGDDYCYASNGYIQLDSVSGNIGSIQKLWSTGDTGFVISGLSSSNAYALTVVDTAGCSETFNFQPNANSNVITASTSTTADFCANGIGSATVFNPGGGIGSYSFAWSNGESSAMIDSLFAGILSVTVTDSVSCSAVFTDTIESTGTPIVAMADTNVDCYGDATASLMVSASNGTAPYSYAWSSSTLDTNMLTGLMAGSYTVTVTDSAGCFDTVTAVISQPDSLNLDSSMIVDSRPDLCVGKLKVYISGGTPGYTYLWNDTAASTNDSATSLCPGTYEVVVTDLNSCMKTYSLEVESLPIPSSARLLDHSEWKINRLNRRVNIVAPQLSDFDVAVYNLNGQLLHQASGIQKDLSFELNNPSPVLIRVSSGDEAFVKKLF